MKKITVLLFCLMLVPLSASAQWTLDKVIDCSAAAPTGTRLKDVQADSSGSLYVTTYFGSSGRIWKIANPITETTPSVVGWESPAANYPSSNAAMLAIDATGNVFLAMDTNDAGTSWVKKYKLDGALDTTFGSSGTLSPVVIDGENRRPRAIGYADAEGGKLLISCFMTPYSVGVVDAHTGADGGAILSTLGDTNDDDTAAENDMWNGLAYDPVANAIYGNAQADLMMATGDSATLSDLSTFTSQTMLHGHTRVNNSSNGLGFLQSDGLVAYTAASDNVQIGVHNIYLGTEEVFLGGTQYGGACTLFEEGGTLYVALVNYYGNAVNVFAGPSAVEGWEQY